MSPRSSRLPLVVVLLIFLTATLCFAAPKVKSVSVPESAKLTKRMPGEILVKYKAGKSGDMVLAAKTHGLSQKKSAEQIRFRLYKLPKGLTVEQVVEKLKKHPAVEYAGPNHVIRIAQVPPQQRFPNDYVFTAGDDLFGLPQWGLYNDGDNNGNGGMFRADIHAPEAWHITTGSPNIIIANIDTGVDYTHEDLWSEGKVLPGYNTITESTDSFDDHGHGTFTAAVSAADTDNYIGIAGVSWGSPILPVKVLDAEGYGTELDGAEGIIWAVDHGAKVLNMSFATDIHEPALEAAIDYAWDHGCLPVCASGNENVGTPMYPAYYENTIAVGASNEFDQRCTAQDWGQGGSNYGSYLDVVAPGSYITSAAVNNIYVEIFELSPYFPESGTSAAAPFVSGIAALIWSIHPDWTNAQVKRQIELTCDDIDVAGWDEKTGWGRANAYRALTESASEPVSLTVAQLSSLESGRTVTIAGAVVTAGSGHIANRIYVEDPDRTAGIMVYYPSGAPTELIPGDKVTVRGKVGAFGSERAIVDATITKDTTELPAPVAPLGMVQKALGGGQLGNNLGITGGVGLPNTGLLVKVFGKVTLSPSSAYTYFYIDDGTGLDDGSGREGLRVECKTLTKPFKNQYVAITGVSTCETLADETVVPIIRVRTQGDIVVVK